MNAELLYTSAPQGLKQGSRGFCTVLSTVGMPLNIATKLESLSGYRHLYPSGTPDAAKNPVNHSHLRLSVGGRTLSILSRISDYGLDYSQRTNKLAHHIVVDTPMPPCGPAALLADPSIMRSEWDGTCANIPTPPAFPALSIEPSPCTLWESITGDAGWAGVVASAWLNTTSKPTFIVFSEDQSDQLLKLLEEAIALLPPSKRWQATFGTYVTNLPPDVECKVRCVVAGSDEARMASARGVVINLTQPLDQPPPSEAVSAARDGNYIGGRPNGPPSIATSGIDEPAGIAPEEESVERPEELKFDPEQPFVTTSTSQPPSLRNSNGRIAPAILIERNQLNNRRTLIFALLASIASISGIIGFLAFNRNLNQSADIASKVGAETIRTEPIERHEKVDVPSINNEKQKNNEMPTVDLPSSPPVLSKEGIGKTSEIQSSDSKPNAPETIIDRKNIAIDVSSFCLPIDSDKKGMIPLIAGIPGSVLQASVKFTGKSNEEQNLFNQLSQEKNGWNWRWERSNDNGKAWTALPDNASSILDANSTSLKIREDDKPNTIYRAILRIKNNGAFTAKDDFIDIHSIPSEATADYVTVQVMANEILSEPKTADVAIYIPAFLKNQYLVSFLATKGSKSLVSANKDRINYLDVRGLFHDTNESVFDKWDKSADVFLRLKRNRNELSDRFLRSKKILRETCKDCNPLVFEHRMSMDVFSKGLNALRDGNQKIASDIDYFSNWNSGEVLAWAEANRNPQIIEDFSKIPPNAIDGARIDNEVNKILKKYWVGRNGKVDGNNEEENWFQFVDKVIEDRKNFLILRNLILDKEFLYLSPESSFGIFSKPSGKSDDFDSASNSLAKKLRPVATVRLWMKIQIRSPSNSHQSPSGGMGGSAGPTDTKVEIKDLPPP